LEEFRRHYVTSLKYLYFGLWGSFALLSVGRDLARLDYHHLVYREVRPDHGSIEGIAHTLKLLEHG